MRKVTPRQAKFVSYLVANGGNGTQAAIAAGCKPGSAAVTACKWLKLPWVREARQRAVWEAFEEAAPICVDALLEIVADKAAQPAARVKAADLVLTRAGIPAINVSRTEIVDSRTEAELRAEALALREELAGFLGPIIDVTPGSNPVAGGETHNQSKAVTNGTGLLDRATDAESEEK